MVHNYAGTRSYAVAHFRVNMGCDGGTIPTRDELVKLKKKPEQVGRDVELRARWAYCALTQQELKSPIVACELGRLYNKESVIKHLLNKGGAQSDFASHIRNLKDVCELKLTTNSSYDRSCLGKADTYVDTQAAEYMCPISGLEMNGRHKFLFLWKNGYVCAERSMKEVPDAVKSEWGQDYDADDVITLNGTRDEEDEMRDRMEKRRAKAKKEKKVGKKREIASSAVLNGKVSSSSLPPPSKVKKEKEIEKVKKEPLKRSEIAAGVMAEAKAAIKQGSSFKSVAENPKASKTYKSLFASSAKPRDKEKVSNWITYNPYHYSS